MHGDQILMASTPQLEPAAALPAAGRLRDPGDLLLARLGHRLATGRLLLLDRSQKTLLDKEVKGLMAWHRQHELPIYARDLDALARAVASPMTPAQVTLHWTAPRPA